MRAGIRAAGVVRVVGDDQRQGQLAGDLAQARGSSLLDRQAVLHDLDEQVARAEDVAQPGRGIQRLPVLAEPQPRLHLAAGAAGGRDQAAGVLGEQVTVQARLTEVALQPGPRGQPEQVVQALGGLGQQGQVGVGAGAAHVVGGLRRGAPADRPPVAARARRQVGLHADDRLDPGRGGLPVELIGAVHVAVISDRDGRHALALAGGDEVAQPGRPVQHGVLGVNMQVREGPARTAPRAAGCGCPARRARWPGACPCCAHAGFTLSASTDIPAGTGQRRPAPRPCRAG